MTHKDARILIIEIEKTGKGLYAHEHKNIKDIRQRLASDTKITHGESMSLQECYRRIQKGEF
jgi:hypothetical protein